MFEKRPPPLLAETPFFRGGSFFKKFGRFGGRKAAHFQRVPPLENPRFHQSLKKDPPLLAQTPFFKGGSFFKGGVFSQTYPLMSWNC